MKLGTQHYLGYIIVLRRLELKTIVILLKLHAKLHFKGFFKVFLNFFENFWHKEVQFSFFGIELGIQIYLVCIIVLKWL